MTIADMQLGQIGIIERLNTPEDISFKLMELGLCPGETVRFCGKAPLGDPIIIELLHYRLTIRESDARKISLSNVS